MKKIVSLMLSLSMLLSVMAGFDYSASAATYNGSCGDNLTWVIDTATVTLTISGTGEMNDFTSAQSDAWKFKNHEIANIIIENGVTSIGDYAFNGCTYLKSVQIPSSVKAIGDYAFYNCSRLSTFEIPEGVEIIGKMAFFSNTADYVTLPNSLTSVGDMAFDAYSRLKQGDFSYSVNGGDYSLAITDYSGSATQLVVPSDFYSYAVTTIGGYAFERCDSIKEVTIHSNIKKIESNPFKYCANIESITVDSDNAYYDSRQNCNAIIEKATNNLVVACSNTQIPNTVKSISPLAFDSCAELTEIIIPNGVTSISSNAFVNCPKLNSIFIPNSVVTIGPASCVENCPSLTSVVVESGNPYYDSRNNCNAIIETATNSIVSGCQNTIIPNTVTSIGYHAFAGCQYMTGIRIPSSVRIIDSYAFAGCSSLVEIDFQNGVTEVGDDAFFECTSLRSVVIPDSVISLGYGAFTSCTSLTSAVIPASVPSIGYYAFTNCPNLAEIIILNPNCKIEAAPDTISDSATIYGYYGSTAQTYAQNNGRNFVALSESTNGWIFENGSWTYYVRGYKVRNQWVQDSTGWCYLGSNGYMVTDSWVMDSVGWCYIGSNGYCVTNCWVRDSVGWCYLNADGRMEYNSWVRDSVGWCYVGADGYMVYDQWVPDSNGMCYIGTDGYYVENNQ